jgi:hypothetical protein
VRLHARVSRRFGISATAISNFFSDICRVLIGRATGDHAKGESEEKGESETDHGAPWETNGKILSLAVSLPELRRRKFGESKLSREDS